MLTKIKNDQAKIHFDCTLIINNILMFYNYFIYNVMFKTCIIRSQNGPVLIASPAGGMDIEDVAENSPELIKKIPIDIFEGVSDELALDIARFLDFKESLTSVVIILVLKSMIK